MQSGCTSKEQLHVVIDLCHRAYGAARVSNRIGLVNGDRRQDALDTIDLGFVHPIKELARVGRESLYVAALTLCIQGIKGQ